MFAVKPILVWFGFEPVGFKLSSLTKLDGFVKAPSLHVYKRFKRYSASEAYVFEFEANPTFSAYASEFLVRFCVLTSWIRFGGLGCACSLAASC
ncbi:hypothetical protein AAHH88_00315 [Candidatus Hodgkinia cicadicola]